MRNPDVQALVYASFAPLRHCRYLLLRVTDAAAARRWLGQSAVLDLVRGGDELRADAVQGEVLAMAFTHAGLLAMGHTQHGDFPFPSAFQEGMNEPARARTLADFEVEKWRWGDLQGTTVDADGAARQQVHLLLAHFRSTPWDAQDAGPLGVAALQAHGLALVEQVNTCPAYIQDSPEGLRVTEPFGFRDGLAQPVLASAAEVSRSHLARRERVGADLAADNVVADGEFVLGLPNEYGDPAYAPDDARWAAGRPPGAAQRFGVHGSYLVVRHIRQFAERFRDFEAEHPATEAGAPSLAEKMVGRRKDGSPLVTVPLPPKDPNAFRFRVNDAEGFQCPLGSHVRRANPRDSLGLDVPSGLANAKLHRLIRRGRVYAGDCRQAPRGTCGHPDAQGTCGQGLFFLALNADLDRQFEFVQQQWIANARFADLANESDPLLGGHGKRDFTVQAPAGGERVRRLPRFTETHGGGYFFLPGLAALRFLLGADERAGTDT